MEIYNGRPLDEAGRDDAELQAYDLLDRLEIHYQRTDHEPATTMEVCRVIDSVLNALICKNLFLCNRQQTMYYLLLMPGDKPFKTKNLSSQLGVSRLSFGSETAMEELLGVHPGSVSVLGLMNDKENRVRLLIDEDVLKEDFFACHPCRNTSSLKFRTTALTEKLLPAMGHTPTLVHLEWESERA